jgi:hypothetical protein
MPDQPHPYDGLSTRDGFNRSLAHFKSVGGMVAEIDRGRNLADVIGERLADKALQPDQVLPVLNALLVDRYHYAVGSHNLAENADSLAGLAAETAGWKAMDLVVAYFHPELGVLAINPKNRAHWDSAGGLKRNELLTVYAGTPAFREGRPVEGRHRRLHRDGGGLTTKAPRPSAKKYVPEGARTAAPARERPPRPRPRAARPAASPAAAAPRRPRRPAAAPPRPGQIGGPGSAMPMLDPVTGDFFRNGNVEAWKKIIQSYTTKYPGLDVFVFYEGERIHDINTLFKWGKVKHGSAILIAVAGADIKDVAKLQRYLKQGASQMFEAFLKAPVNAVLNLF